MDERYYDFLPDEKVELKPCKICGGKADLYGIFIPYDYDEANCYICGCRNCNKKYKQLWDYDDIVKKWNEGYEK